VDINNRTNIRVATSTSTITKSTKSDD
jgi:hypothetical protein